MHRFDFISALAPHFFVNGASVKILKSPKDFHETLKILALGCNKRIILSTLYLGTGHLEKELVDCIEKALCAHSETGKPSSSGTGEPGRRGLEFRALMDYSRANRGDVNSCTMLQSLLDRFPENVQVSLYHTPNLRSWRKWLLPDRWNEVVGVQHMKLYIFDDTLLISGANLSDQYFVNRQDRYVVVEECPALADYCADLISAVSDCSFQLKPGGRCLLHPKCIVHPYQGSYGGYRDLVHGRVSEVIARGRSIASTLPRLPNSDTLIYPVIQMDPFGIQQDSQVLEQLFQTPDGSQLDVASGYFNLTTVYTDILLRLSQGRLRVLMASPQANGFHTGKGLSGYIPSVYTHALREFYDCVSQAYDKARAHLFEYYRQGWTFHAKGLWLTAPGQTLPSATVVGSTNYGYRSTHRDLEAQLVVVTENANLKQELANEVTSLLSYGHIVDSATFRRPDHYVPVWVRLISRFIRSYF